MLIKLSAFPAVCDPPCHNYGVCVAPNSCDCPPGYPGLGCSGTNLDYITVICHLDTYTIESNNSGSISHHRIEGIKCHFCPQIIRDTKQY